MQRIALPRKYILGQSHPVRTLSLLLSVSRLRKRNFRLQKKKTARQLEKQTNRVNPFHGKATAVADNDKKELPIQSQSAIMDKNILSWRSNYKARNGYRYNIANKSDGGTSCS